MDIDPESIGSALSYANTGCWLPDIIDGTFYGSYEAVGGAVKLENRACNAGIFPCIDLDFSEIESIIQKTVAGQQLLDIQSFLQSEIL